MELARAGELMIPLDKYPHLPYWFTLRQAMAEFENSSLEIDGRKSLPRVALVFDERYQLLGMVRRRDILRGMEPEFLASLPPTERRQMLDNKEGDVAGLSLEKIMDEARRRARLKVSEILVPVECVADHDDHIIKVIYEMNSNKVALVPVMKEGQVVGVIRSVDIFHQFAKLIL